MCVDELGADTKLMAKAKRRLNSDDRNSTALYSPLKDKLIYEFQFADGSEDDIKANVIAEYMCQDVMQRGTITASSRISLSIEEMLQP